MRDASGIEIFLVIVGLITCLFIVIGFFTPNALCIPYGTKDKLCIGVHWEPTKDPAE